MSEQEIPFGKIKGTKIVQNAWDDHPEREIGEIRDGDADASVEYFRNRFEELSTKIDELEKEIASSQNKGSFLMKLIHLKDQLPIHDGLGDYPALHEKLLKMEQFLQDNIRKNRERNTEIKEALLQEVKAAAEKINWKEATTEIHDIKSRWIKTGNAEEEHQDKLEDEFWEIVGEFFEKKKRFYEDKKRLGELRKKDYELLIEKADKLKELSGKERAAFIRTLRDEWREVGNIPKEEYVDLLNVFNRKLKASAPSGPSIDLRKVNKELQEYLNGNKVFHFRVINDYKNTLKNYRPANPSEKELRNDSFQKIQILMESDFIDKIATKRFKNFKELEKPKKQSIRIGILEELLGRDKNDLAKFQENSANFSGSDGSMMSLVDKKIREQKRKIATKEALLKKLRTEK